MNHKLLALLAALALMIGFVGTSPADAAERTRCFDETGFCVSGSILTYWEKNGGLSVFGYPISQLYQDSNDGWTGPTQWFQRDRLEDHGAQGVMAGRLGAQYLEMRGRAWQSYPNEADPGSTPGCRYFAQTSKTLCGKFLNYWLKNGGLERFGYPITPLLTEQVEGKDFTIQYFERRRMELHPENAGTPYEVLLGLLGTQVYTMGHCTSVNPTLQATVSAYHNLGCPISDNVFVGVRAVQPFERGAMVWVQTKNPPELIYVIYFDQTRGSLVSTPFNDTWEEGDTNSSGQKVPAGLYEPIRGFGKVWRENPSIRNTIGWATAPESSDNGIYQAFSTGAVMLYRSTADRIYILYLDGRVDDIARIK